MAIARVKTWSAGEVLTASDLNSEFNNLINNPVDLWSPAGKAADMNGFELVLDADADTSITADTDDQIDIKIGGSDRVSLTANRGLNLAKYVQGSAHICQLRLTLTSGTAVTTSDVTAATTLYAALYGGNQVALWDGTTDWIIVETAELSIAVPATTDTVYDVFLDYNDGTPALALTAWTNDTTRATALTKQDGVYVKTGDTQQRYLGSFRTTGVSGQTEDSYAKRYVWSYYNRFPRPMRVVEATNTWNYSSGTLQQANNSAANQLDMVIGVSEDLVRATAVGYATNSTSTGRLVRVAIGLDAVGTNSKININAVVNDSQGNHTWAIYEEFPGVGRHYLTWCEAGAGSDTQTWIGDNGNSASEFQTGIHGVVWG